MDVLKCRQTGEEPTLEDGLADRLRKKLAHVGQQQLLTFWDELDVLQRRQLATQIESVDLAQVNELFRQGVAQEDWEHLGRIAQPPSAVRLGEADHGIAQERAYREGCQALAAGQVGVLLVAGGQGTRLGFFRPKGIYPIGPISNASLLQLHIEKIVATRNRHGVSVPLYLMTSPATHEEIVAFLHEHNRFGLAAEDLWIFQQSTMPAVDAKTGQILLGDRDRLFLSPNGHGGVVEALHNSKALDDIVARNLTQLYYFQVDNVLTPICDPYLIGHHRLARSEMTTLVVAKNSPEDKLGNMVSIDGHLQIIEYIDLPAAAGERRRSDGSLWLWAGSIATHVFEVIFLKRMIASKVCLPFHVSRKSVPHLNTLGQRVEPDCPNALKFERFVFDLLPLTERAIAVEAERREVFAPLKNATGAATDTPETVREQMIALHRDWLRTAGAKVANDVVVEISPLFALGPEDLRGKLTQGALVSEKKYFRR